MTTDINKLPKVGAVVTSIKIHDNTAGGNMVEIEFIDSDCEAMSHGYVPHDNRKRVMAHLYIERDKLEEEILKKYVYPKDAVYGYAPDVPIDLSEKGKVE